MFPGPFEFKDTYLIASFRKTRRRSLGLEFQTRHQEINWWLTDVWNVAHQVRYVGNVVAFNGWRMGKCAYVYNVIKRKHFPRYWPFVRGIHRSPINSPHKGQWRGALVFSLIWAWTNGWVNNRDAGAFGCYRAHYDVTVMTRDGVMTWRLFLYHCIFRGVYRSPIDSSHIGRVFFVVSLKKLNELSVWQWFEMPLRSCDATVLMKDTVCKHSRSVSDGLISAIPVIVFQITGGSIVCSTVCKWEVRMTDP